MVKRKSPSRSKRTPKKPREAREALSDGSIFDDDWENPCGACLGGHRKHTCLRGDRNLLRLLPMCHSVGDPCVDDSRVGDPRVDDSRVDSNDELSDLPVSDDYVVWLLG